MDHRVSVVIPALNEAESIAAVVREMPWALIRECIVVDNGSTDATAAEASAAGARVVAASQRGYGRACAAGAAAAQGDILVFMDGDGSDVSAEMDQLLRPIIAGECDFVIGSRHARYPRARQPANLADLRRMDGGGPSPPALPCPIHRHGPLPRHHAPGTGNACTCAKQTYGWNLEMQMRAAQCGLRIREIPVSYRKRCRRRKQSCRFAKRLRASRHPHHPNPIPSGLNPKALTKGLRPPKATKTGKTEVSSRPERSEVEGPAVHLPKKASS